MKHAPFRFSSLLFAAFLCDLSGQSLSNAVAAAPVSADR
jgi:hypothetical protein